MNNYKVILENSLKAWNANHKPALDYGNDGGKSEGLKLLGEMRFLIRCTKSQAIDILDLLTALEYKKEEMIKNA